MIRSKPETSWPRLAKQLVSRCTGWPMGFCRQKVLLLVVLLLGYNRLEAQKYSLDPDSIAAQIQFRMDEMAYDIFLLRKDHKITVYKNLRDTLPMPDNEIIGTTDSGSTAKDPEAAFRQAQYRLYTIQRGISAYPKPEFVQLDYGKVAFWVEMDQLKEQMDPDAFVQLTLFIQNRYGFDPFQDSNAKPDTTLRQDTTDFIINSPYKIHLEIYFVEEIRSSINYYVSHHMNYNNFTGFFYDSSLNTPVIKPEDLFPVKNQTQMTMIVEAPPQFSDFYKMTYNADSQTFKLVILDPGVIEEEAVAKGKMINVYCPSGALRNAFSEFSALWFSGLYDHPAD